MKTKSTRQELMHYATEYTIGKYRISWEGNSWGIYEGMFCYNKATKEFEYEPFPSSRDNDFYRKCRFGLLEAKQIVESLNNSCSGVRNDE